MKHLQYLFLLTLKRKVLAETKEYSKFHKKISVQPKVNLKSVIYLNFQKNLNIVSKTRTS